MAIFRVTGDYLFAPKEVLNVIEAHEYASISQTLIDQIFTGNIADLSYEIDDETLESTINSQLKVKSDWLKNYKEIWIRDEYINDDIV